MMVHPPYLSKGDTIAIVCPAGHMPAANANSCTHTLEAWGYKVQLGKTIGSQYHYFSGTDEERLADLQTMLDDAEIKAILCGRGGYGTSRIIDQLKWKKFKKNPKWIIGFSDVTVLHSFLFSRLKTASIHAPMAAAFAHGGSKNKYVLSLKNVLEGGPISYGFPKSKYNKLGQATGRLVGGNLSIIIHQIGTPSDIDTKGKILFLEDVGEYFYNVDRMMLQLLRAGKLSDIKGLIIGGFTEMKDTQTPFGNTIEELILQKLKTFNYPVCFHFPVSHGKTNYALKVGAKYQLTVAGKVQLAEVAEEQ